MFHINKEDIVRVVKSRTGYRSSVVDDVVSCMLDVIVECVGNGNTVRFSGFGSFEPKQRAARTGRNPHSGEAVPIPPRIVPVFHPGDEMKRAVMPTGEERKKK